jgi:hypothetical protein
MIKFDDEQFIRDMEDALKIILEESAREWLRAVVHKVPIWSGEAVASLLPLAGYLDEEIEIHPVLDAPEGGIERGIKQSRYKFEFTGGKMSFIFDELVPHYLINDFNRGLGQPPLIHPTPWRSLEAGREAFNRHFKQTIKDAFPKRMSKYFVFK